MKVKSKLTTIGIILATVILAGVAVFTAIRLYQLRKESITPTSPTSQPAAAEDEEYAGTNKCKLSFTLENAAPTTTPTPASCNKDCNTSINPPVSCVSGLTCYTTSSLDGAGGVCRNPDCTSETDCTCPTASPKPKACNETCLASSDCDSDYICSGGKCRNSDCTSETDCTCPEVTDEPTEKPTTAPTKAPTAKPTVTARPTAEPTASPEPSLPNAGTSLPTIFGISLGTLILVGALILAL